jgi:hypothetical protein
MQSKLGSLIESCANTLSGVIIAFYMGRILFPLMEIEVSVDQNVVITGVFTAVSLIRSYIWRRIFNHNHRRKFQ